MKSLYATSALFLSAAVLCFIKMCQGFYLHTAPVQQSYYVSYPSSTQYPSSGVKEKRYVPYQDNSNPSYGPSDIPYSSPSYGPSDVPYPSSPSYPSSPYGPSDVPYPSSPSYSSSPYGPSDIAYPSSSYGDSATYVPSENPYPTSAYSYAYNPYSPPMDTSPFTYPPSDALYGYYGGASPSYSNVMETSYPSNSNQYNEGSSSYSTYEPISQEYQAEYDYFHGSEVLDNKGRYYLQWIVDYYAKTITFNITVRSKGWVGLGFSKDGTMKNADIVLAEVKGYGVEPSLKDYFSDYERRLYSDARQDWNLVYAETLNGITHLQISRALDTCDPYDYPITEDLVHIIWAYGETETYDYHFDKRGSFRVYLLEPILRTKESPLTKWRITKSMVLKQKKTSNWCSVHKAPRLSSKNHIVEIHPYFPDALSRNHTHIILLWKCWAPAGQNARDIFEPLLDYPGEECFFPEKRVIPTQYCMNVYHKWAIGGKPYILPYDVGFPLGEAPDEYWLLESNHYNPEEQPLHIEAGLDVYYTNQLRKNDGEMMVVGYDLFGLFMIPPISTNFEVYGICTSGCTQEMIPPEGIEIVSVTLHADYSARKMKLQHFRNGYELPWIAKDDNYDTTFQQWKNLYKPRLVLPGDELIMSCEYDNTNTNGTVLSGFQLTEEMCVADIVINKRIPYFACWAKVNEKSLLGLIGVREYDRDFGSGERIVTSPRSLKGQLLSDVADAQDWNKALRYKIQGITTYTPQNGSCPQISIPAPQNHGGSVQHHTALSHARSYAPAAGEYASTPPPSDEDSKIAMYPYKAPKYRPERYCRESFPGFYSHNSYATNAGYQGAPQGAENHPNY